MIRFRIPLRSSTNPTLVIPRKLGHIKLFEELEAGAFCFWLPLSRHFGTMLTMSRRFNDFIHQDLPDDAARVFNRLYLGQLLEMSSTRHCFANSALIHRFADIGARRSVGSHFGPRKSSVRMIFST